MYTGDWTPYVWTAAHSSAVISRQILINVVICLSHENAGFQGKRAKLALTEKLCGCAGPRPSARRPHAHRPLRKDVALVVFRGFSS